MRMPRVENIFTFGGRHKLAALALVILVSAIALNGLKYLRIDTSYESLISEQDADWPAYQQTVADFGSDNTTIVYIKDDDLWTPEKLFLLEELMFELEEIDKVEKVESVFSALSIRDADGYLEIDPLLEMIPSNEQEADALRDNAVYSPLITGNLISEDGTVIAINVIVDRSGRDPDFNRAFDRQIEDVLAPLRDRFNEVFQIGPPRLNAEIERAMFADLQLLTPLSSLVLFASILYFLRTGVSCVIPIATSLVSISWTFGFMGYAGIPLSLLTAIVPSLVIVIGSTEDTHMLNAYLHGVKNRKPDRARAVRYMASHVGLPIFITSFTTAIGFFSNALSEIPLIREFAYTAAFAMLANLVATVLVVPLLLTLMGPKRNSLGAVDEMPTGLVGKIQRILDIVGEKHGPKVMIITACLLIGFGYTATRVQVSNDPLSYFHDDNLLVRHADQVHEDLAGVQLYYLTLTGTGPYFFREPENMKLLERVVAVLRAQTVTDDTGGRVAAYDKVIALSDYIALLNREKNGTDIAFHRVPDTRSEIDQFLAGLNRGDIERFVTADESRVNIVVRHNLSDSHQLNRTLEDVERRIARFLPGSVSYHVTGENLMINRAAESLFASQVESLIILISIIMVIMSVLYTSVLAGLVSLLPNMIPVVFNFGIMGLFEIPLNPGTATVAAIAVGIAVDDTIHLMTRYAEQCRKEPDQKIAAQNTVRSQAVPVISTSISLALGFGVLYFSGFQIVAQFGLLAALTMIYALLSDLLVTPVVLRTIRLVGMYEIIGLTLDKKVLDSCPLFTGMTKYQIKKSILLSQLGDFKQGDVIMKQGTRERKLYVILEGQVEIVREEGDQIVKIVELGEGSVIGEIAFVHDDVERSATARALGNTKMMSMEWESTRKGLRFYPGIAALLNANIGRILGERLATTTRQLARVKE